MSSPAATVSSSHTEYTARWPLIIRKEFFLNLPVTDANTAYTAKQKASRIERAPIFSISSCSCPLAGIAGPSGHRAPGRACLGSRRARVLLHLGLGFVLGCALRLDFAGVENTVGTQLSIR